MFANTSPKGLAITTPFNCLYIWLLKLNSTPRVAISIDSQNVSSGNGGQSRLANAKLANAKESLTQYEDYNFRTGAKISVSHLTSSCKEEPIIDKIGLSGMFFWVFWASHAFAIAVSLWAEPYHKHHEP